MTGDSYRKIPKEDKKLFNDSLKLVTNFMTNDNDDKKRYRIKLISAIEQFIRSNPEELDEKEREKLKTVAGICIPNENRNIIFRKLNLFPLKKSHKCKVAINKALALKKFEELLVLVHEINHADTMQYEKTKKFVVLFSGLRRFVFEDINTTKIYGTGLNEIINELYAQIQVYSVLPDIFTNISSLDELIYSFKIPEYKVGFIGSGLPYRRMGIISKLLLIASDNDLTTSYESLKNSKNKFIEKPVLLNGQYCVKNDLLYAGKQNAREYGERFDQLCEKTGSFVHLLKGFDILLSAERKKEPYNIKAIANIIGIIDKYKDAKYNAFINNGLWDQEKKEIHEYAYSTYRDFLCKQYGIDPNSIQNESQDITPKELETTDEPLETINIKSK